MPSASNSAKIEKQQSSTVNTAEVADNSSPIRQVLVVIEHKIRNLEKRKSKLEMYRDLEKTGKELSADRKIAVSKYGEVSQTLELAREFFKQILAIATSSEKELRKKQKKEETAKKQGEISKVREVLIMQDILNMLTDDVIREDFLNETNGACKLETSELDLLDKFLVEVTPKRPAAPDETPFKNAVQRSAEHLLLTIDAKPKQFGGETTTYADVKTVLKNIQKCPYFEKSAQSPVVEEEDLATCATVPKDDSVEQTVETSVQECVEKTTNEMETVSNVEPDFHEAPSAAAVPVPTFPPQQQPPQQQQQSHHQQQPPQAILNAQPSAQLVQPIPIVQPIVPVVGIAVSSTVLPIPQPQPMHPQHLAPTTVRAVEQAYFKQHQYMQPQMRPLAEVIGARNFFFLQDSELDTPEQMQGSGGGGGAGGANYPQQQSQPVTQPQISPSSNQQSLPSTQQPLLQQQAPPQIIQTQPSQHQQQQISTQTFTNQSFPNIVPSPMFAALKPGDVPPQPHIPGFAAPNAPIPIPLVQNVVSPQQQQQQQMQQSPSQSQPIPTAVSSVVNMHGGGVSGAPISSFPTTGKFIAPAIANQSPIITNNKPQQPTLPGVKEVRMQPQQNETKSMIVEPPIEQRVPEITEWKPEDVNKTAEEITEWRDPYQTVEVTDWNDDTNDDSNTWSNNNQRYQYRNHQGGNGNYNGRNNRGPGRGNSGGGANGSNSGSNGGPTNGYRNRPNSSYQQNGGRQSGNNNSGGTGGGGGGGNPNTFYRNNENNYYQNGAGYRDSKEGGGTGSYRDKDSGGYRDNKQDGGYRGGNYRSREIRDQNNSSIRGGGGGGAGGTASAPSTHTSSSSSRNNRFNSNSAERGNNQTVNNNPVPQRASISNTSNRNGPNGGGGTSGGTTQPRGAAVKVGGNVYGGGPRPTGGRPQQAV